MVIKYFIYLLNNINKVKMAKYTIDSLHSEVTFKVKHLMISTVTGSFKIFNSSIEAENEDFSDAKFDFSADINSIDTNNEQRDTHLKSADFFDAENHNTLNFKSTGIQVDGNELKITGDFTLRGVTKTITLHSEYAGKMVDFYGNEKHGFEFNTKISRKEFGLEWGAVTEAGGVVVSDEVKIIINAQYAKN